VALELTVCLCLGASLPLKYFFSGFKKCRWSLGAKEVCFTQPWHSIMFRLGQVLPIVRGAGVYQPVMDQILEELNRGCWLHIYPEGKVNMDKSFLRLKWGVGRLITDAAVTPIVLPFYHHGLDTILANYPPYVPQTKKRITVVWGEPLYLDAFLTDLRAQKKSAVSVQSSLLQSSS
jgi:monolysocardiolipin acyltransferase